MNGAAEAKDPETIGEGPAAPAVTRGLTASRIGLITYTSPCRVQRLAAQMGIEPRIQGARVVYPVELVEIVRRALLTEYPPRLAAPGRVGRPKISRRVLIARLERQIAELSADPVTERRRWRAIARLARNVVQLRHEARAEKA